MTPQKPSKDFDYQQIDDVIHSRIRLAIMAVLVAREAEGESSTDFTFLREKVKATDGNLSIHLRKLEEAGYTEMKKDFVERKPVTSYKLTANGKTAFVRYIDHLEALVRGG